MNTREDKIVPRGKVRLFSWISPQKIQFSRFIISLEDKFTLFIIYQRFVNLNVFNNRCYTTYERKLTEICQNKDFKLMRNGLNRDISIHIFKRLTLKARRVICQIVDIMACLLDLTAPSIDTMLYIKKIKARALQF